MNEVLAKIKQMIEEAQREEKRCAEKFDFEGRKYYEGVQDGLLNTLMLIRGSHEAD